MRKIIRLGSRGSPLALLQAEYVRRQILNAHPTLPTEAEIEIVPIRTSGDWRPGHQELSFRELGGSKELFTKEIEEALSGNHIDMAVHSMKDVSSHLPEGLIIAALLERIDPRDAFIGRDVSSLDDLPEGAVVGTSSLRRQAQLLIRRPDLKIVPLRGNVETRLKKLADGMADATLLALAGLQRLGLEHRASSAISTDIMLPAAAQGSIGVEIRQGDDDILRLLTPINHAETSICVGAERALLKTLDGSCHTPIGALAQLTGGGQLLLEGMAAKPDGSESVRMQMTGSINAAAALGVELGREMKGRLPLNFFAA